MLKTSLRLFDGSHVRGFAKSLIPFPFARKKPEDDKPKPPKTDDRRRRPPSQLMLKQAAEVEKKTMYFDEIRHDLRSKLAYRTIIADFLQRDIRRTGHVEFIYAALKRMKQFGVEKDLEVYKDLLNVFPKGRFVAQNMWQVEFQHYPKHQECCVDILQAMELNGVVPDSATYHIVLNTFGDRSIPMRKLKRIFYWTPKFKNANPYPIPFILPEDPMEKARLALERMCPDVRRKISTFQTKDFPDAVDRTWVASCMCPDQRAIIQHLPPDRPLFVEGEFVVHLRDTYHKYFILRDEPDRLLEPGEIMPAPYYEQDCKTDWDLFFKTEKPKEYAPAPSLHEQEDGKILAMCITGSGSKDSLLTWISYLSKSNPGLLQRPILFRMKSLVIETSLTQREEESTSRPIIPKPSSVPFDGSLL